MMLDENGNPTPVKCSREAIESITRINEPTKVIYARGKGEKIELEAKEGDLVIAFYDEDFPNRAIVVSNEQWNENLKTYEEIQQKREEEWAAKQPKCAKCDCASNENICAC